MIILYNIDELDELDELDKKTHSNQNNSTQKNIRTKTTALKKNIRTKTGEVFTFLPGNDWCIDNTQEYQTYDGLIKRYVGTLAQISEVNTAQGTSNIVDTYTLMNGNKISVRKSKEPSFVITPRVPIGYNGFSEIKTDVSRVPIYFKTGSKEEFMTSIENTRYNHNDAYKYGISPEIYFYGYIRGDNTQSDESFRLYNVIVSEGYDQNLREYYKCGDGLENIKTGRLTVNDINIMNQLIVLLENTHKMLNLICFDIKPDNCVIKMDSSGKMVVKLVDWDSDWCKNKLILVKTGPESQAKLIQLLSVIIMANHFWMPKSRGGFDWNIFRNYFLDQSKLKELEDSREALKIIFYHYNSYARIAKHYFFREVINIQPEEMFDEMIKRCMQLNTDDPVVLPGWVLHPPTTRLRSSRVPGGGRKSKKGVRMRRSKRTRRTNGSKRSKCKGKGKGKGKNMRK